MLKPTRLNCNPGALRIWQDLIGRRLYATTDARFGDPMTLPFWLVRKQIAGCLAMLLASPFAAAAPTPFPQPLSEPQSPSSAQAPTSNTVQSNPAQTGAKESAPAQSASQSEASDSAQTNAGQQPKQSPQPVGTAAAPAEKPLGVAASRPAGAVIAPAKQRRARSIFIKVGVVVGACVALGTVAALSRSSSSTPH